MKNNRKITIILVILLVLTASIITIITVVGGIHPLDELSTSQRLSEQTDTPQNTPVESVVIIENGDTLWAIMREYYGNEVHGQKAIYKIRKYNDISAREYLQPGMEIKLPDID